MRNRALLAVGLAAAVAAAAPASAPAAAVHAKRPAKKVRLTAFDSCADLVAYARLNALRTLGTVGLGPQPAGRVPATATPPQPSTQGGAPGAAQPQETTAPAAGPTTDFSQTNVQEAGIDEPDIVKTDGNRIFAVAAGKLHAVDARAETPRLVGTLDLENGWDSRLLLHGNHLLVISQAPYAIQPLVAGAASVLPFGPGQTLLSDVDVSDPAHMRVVRTMHADGSFVDARLHGAIARVVLSSPPPLFDAPVVQETTIRARIRRAGIAAWRPVALVRRGRRGPVARRALVACDDVRRPSTFSGLGMLTVLTIDLAKGLNPVDSDALMTDAQTVYASAGSLYVATQRWLDPQLTAQDVPSGLSTAIHRFDISDPDRTDYRASGTVPGFLLNQFSLSEQDGYLRAASTTQPTWLSGDQPPEQSQSYVTVLHEDAGRLAQVGQVGGLGKGERIYAVRFIGDAGFVVTFRQVDPLFTIDLSKPAEPKVRGQLDLLGYSAYLHPVGEGLLLGVGQDASDQGQVRGTKLTLFDVSDLAHPARVAQRGIGQASSSQVEFDHHAFLYWPPTALAVVPVQIYQQKENERPFVGAVGFRVDRAKGIDEVGRVAHDTGDQSLWPIQRSVVIGGRLFTMSDAGLLASSLDSLGRLAFVAFPQPPQPEPQPTPEPGRPGQTEPGPPGPPGPPGQP